jgi:hypothetical protein
MPSSRLDGRTKIQDIKLAFKSFHFKKHYAGPYPTYASGFVNDPLRSWQ